MSNDAAVTIKEMVLNHEKRILVLERLAWKLVGGVIVGTTIGTTIGGAIVAYMLGKL